MANDNDVKIFDDTVNLSDFVPFDTETATAMMQQVAQEKQNGNLGKARRMGARLAEDIAAIDHATPPANGAAENAALMTQRRILLAFAAEHDYSVDKPSFREVAPGHFVQCNDAEFAKYQQELRK